MDHRKSNPYSPPAPTSDFRKPFEPGVDENGCFTLAVAVGLCGMGVAFTLIAIASLPQIYLSYLDSNYGMARLLLGVAASLAAGVLFSTSGILINRRRFLLATLTIGLAIIMALLFES